MKSVKLTQKRFVRVCGIPKETKFQKQTKKCSYSSKVGIEKHSSFLEDFDFSENLLYLRTPANSNNGTSSSPHDFLLIGTLNENNEKLSLLIRKLVTTYRPHNLFVALELEPFKRLEKLTYANNVFTRTYSLFNALLTTNTSPEFLSAFSLSKQLKIPIYGLPISYFQLFGVIVSEEGRKEYGKVIENEGLEAFEEGKKFKEDVEFLFRIQPEAIFYRKTRQQVRTTLRLAETHFPSLFKQIIHFKASAIVHSLLSIASHPSSTSTSFKSSSSDSSSSKVTIGIASVAFFDSIEKLWKEKTSLNSDTSKSNSSGVHTTNFSMHL